ncbi:MAG: DUF3945 domain-containing protein [Prevotellaceae bacterium]|jgi:hypothetical protein|nr:DUF3945 domain-containing protein [Prevotellaceae bacterium]
MNEKLKDQDVLLVKEKDSDEMKVVKGIDSENGKLDTVSPKPENQQDFMKIDKHGNMLNNFLDNFNRQFKNPTHFLFFKAPADKAEETANNLEAALKNPETPENKRLLDMHKVEPKLYKNTHAINPNLVQWEKFEKYGITRESLEKLGEMDKLLDYQKTNLLSITIKFDTETLRTDGRFSLKKMEDGSFAPSVHLIRKKPELERPYFGIEFSEEDKKNLLETGNLGRVVDAEFKTGEKTPILLSLDKQTNELVAFRKEWLRVPDTYKGAQLNEEQKQKLGNGEKVKIEGMTSTKGEKFDGEVQFNADKRYFLPVFNNKRQNQDNKQGETKEFHIPKTLRGVELSKKQREDLKAGKAVYVFGMTDDNGSKFNSYVHIKVNTEQSRLDFLKWNPDKKTQVAKNNESNTTEKQEKKPKSRKVA